MNAEQMKKWSAIREKGQSSYLLKRIFLWGTILSVIEIAFSALIRFMIAEPIADSLFYAIFSKEHIKDNEGLVVRFATDHFFGVLSCFLLAGFVALAVWTYKEQLYANDVATKTEVA